MKKIKMYSVEFSNNTKVLLKDMLIMVSRNL